MFRWVSNLFGRSAPPADERSALLARLAHRVRELRARYDAVQDTEQIRKHFANADGLSARSANSPDVRYKFRTRSRYETANNSYLKGMTLTLANDVIGTGPRLRVQLPDTQAGRRIEWAF